MAKYIYWTLVDEPRLPREQVGSFLSSAELQKLSSLRFPKRREEWLLGRWAAKSLAQSLPGYRQFALSELEVRNSPDGSPYLCLPSGDPAPDGLSISHSHQLALVAMVLGPGIRIGADLEKIEPRTHEFVEDYFTTAEGGLVGSFPAEVRDTVSTLIWSAKESMLKALQVGLRWDTRQVEILRILGLRSSQGGRGSWQGIQVGDPKPSGRHWIAWWQRRDDFLMTIVGMASDAGEFEAVELLERSGDRKSVV
jgi:4'-phosphopantetheinyl transferase